MSDSTPQPHMSFDAPDLVRIAWPGDALGEDDGPLRREFIELVISELNRAGAS
jgi:hypothetical protein